MSKFGDIYKPKLNLESSELGDPYSYRKYVGAVCL